MSVETEHGTGVDEPEPTAFGVVLNEDEAQYLKRLFDTADLVGATSFTSGMMPSGTISQPEKNTIFRLAQIDPALVPGFDANRAMLSTPQTMQEWLVKNLLWMTALGSFVYVFSEVSAVNPDMTLLLSYANAEEIRSIAIIPGGTRGNMDMANLSMTSMCIGEAEARSLLPQIQTLI